MNNSNRRQHEAAVIVMAAVVGEAPAEDLARLDAWIREDPSLAEFVVELIGQEAWLSWHSVAAPLGVAQLRDLLSVELAPTNKTRLPIPTRNLALAASLLVACGALLGGAAMRWYDQSRRSAAAPGLAQWVKDAPAPYVARFVSGTACLWNPETTAPFAANSAFGAGESLNLLEGLAEFQFDWPTGSANIKLEGPASLVLAAARGASLTRGRFTADVQVDDGAFVLGTPNGQVELSRDASIGVVVQGDAVELHVFRGAATFVTPWSNDAAAGEHVAVGAGQSLTLTGAVDGRMRQRRAAARPADFAAQVSMRSDDLIIPPQYVADVLRARPLVYWRFEADGLRYVRNEAGDRYRGRVQGGVEWIDERGNGAVHFGGGLTPEEIQSYVVADDPLTEDLAGGYTVELWIKPSHYHWGTIVSFIGPPPQPGQRDVHGMLFELGGPIAYESAIEHPGRLRFLHRSPPSDNLNTGTSCFSRDPYARRTWQHIAAVKDRSQMRLYINGELVATGEDVSTLPPGLRVIVGQLDERRVDRPFTGQLDELAIYPRALSHDELRRHYDLVRNSAPRPAKERDI